MNAAKSKSKKQPTGFATRIMSVVRLIPGAALLFSGLPMIVLGYLAWLYWGAEHVDQALYALKLHNLSVTEQPEWIQDNVLEEVFDSNRLDRLSLLDPQASATVAHAFESHHWVLRANRVTKSVGGKVAVDLVYRQPAAMVYFKRLNASGNHEDTSEGPSDGFFPIDQEGVILPTDDFDEDDVFRHFVIIADGAVPAGDIGMSYGDPRILEALELCNFLEPHRERLDLQRVYVEREIQAGSPSQWILDLVTKDNLQIAWGHAPGMEAPGEPTAEAKLERLTGWLASVRDSETASRSQRMRATSIDLSRGRVTNPVSHPKNKF